MRHGMLGILLGLAMTHAQADTSHDAAYTDRYARCLEGSGGEVVERLRCVTDELVAQDTRLNGAYGRLRDSLPEAERRQQLLEAQQLWIRYRDANCHFYEEAQGAALTLLPVKECMLRETAWRASELESVLAR